jgi:hypothetical protein
LSGCPRGHRNTVLDVAHLRGDRETIYLIERDRVTIEALNDATAIGTVSVPAPHAFFPVR